MSDEKQLYVYPQDEEVYLTWEEASKEGFCPMCGYFVLGSGEDRTLAAHGVCTECLDELRYETGDHDHDDYYDDFEAIGY